MLSQAFTLKRLKNLSKSRRMEKWRKTDLKPCICNNIFICSLSFVFHLLLNHLEWTTNNWEKQLVMVTSTKSLNVSTMGMIFIVP
jgi:hypothetical protein